MLHGDGSGELPCKIDEHLVPRITLARWGIRMLGLSGVLLFCFAIFRRAEGSLNEAASVGSDVARSTDLLVPVPNEVSPEQASLAYLTQLVTAAMRQAPTQSGAQLP